MGHLPSLREVANFPQAVDAYFKGLEQEDAFSGVVTITQGNAQQFAGAYGYASRAWKIPNTLDTRFDTASITKLFTAVAILQLLDHQYLTLETPVIPFLGLEGTNISPDVNVYHLLTHTSGIGDDADEEAGERYEDLWKSKPNYAVIETADFLPQFIHKPSNFAPGQGCRYCNCGYILLGLLIEKVGGLPYRDYVRQHIFHRAGMAHSDFLSKGEVHEKIAEGSDPITDTDGRVLGWKKNIYAFPPIGSPDAGAYVTAYDLDRFLRAVKAGELLSPQRTQLFFTPQVYHSAWGEGAQHYGLGLWFLLDQEGRVVFSEKEGINAGVSGLIRQYPAANRADDLHVVLLSNREDGVWQPIRKVHELLVAAR